MSKLPRIRNEVRSHKVFPPIIAEVIGAILFWGSLIVMIALTACGSYPYLEIGVGHDAQEMDHYTNVNGVAGEPYSLACGVGTGEVGLEWASGWSVAYYHQSCVESDRYAEKEVDVFLLRKKWGGLRQ